MKKLLIPLLATAFLAAGASAEAAVTPGTNIVTKINIQLSYTSAISTNTTTTTKTITVGKTKVPETFTITTDKAASKGITTSDVLTALLAPASVPKGAYLAHVTSGLGLESYFAIRVGDTNFLALTGQITQGAVGADVRNGKSTSSVSGVSVAKGSKEVSVLNLTLTTGTLTFNVQALDVQTYTGGTVTVGGFGFPVSDQAYTVIGTGSDSVGPNEIVTGTITANGATAGN